MCGWKKHEWRLVTVNKDRRFFLKDTEFQESIEQVITLISEVDNEIFSRYVEVTRHIMELNKLFYVFRYNLKNLLDHFVLNTNDLIESKDAQLSDDEYYYQINALTINFISSAKTLTDSIEVCMKSFLSAADFSSFKEKVISKQYDDKFSYRFLIHMRHYAQHGHLPINIHEQKAYFDLDEILSMPHFDLNRKLKNEIDELKADIYNQFGNMPYISYVFTIAEFNLIITEIYFKFLNEVKPILVELNNKKNQILNEHPEYRFVNPDGSINAMIFYYNDVEGFHCFNGNDNSIEMYASMKREVKKILKNETHQYNKLRI